jgi:hypothetical protein
MNKNKLIVGIAILALSTSMIFTSCVRERDTDIELAKDEVIGDFVYSDAFHIASDASTKNTGENLANYKTTGYCASLIHDTMSSPRTMVIDFGALNCMCNDGRTRRGKILVAYTTHFSDSSNVINFNFENYFVNDYHVMGTQVVENKGHNLLGQSFFSQEVVGKILKADTSIKDTLQWNASRQMTWVAGEDTPMWFDDVYETIGTGNGRGVRYEYYAMNITQPLVREVMCRYIKAGKVELQPQGKALRTIDYGNGECDNQASAEINNKRYAVDL